MLKNDFDTKWSTRNIMILLKVIKRERKINKTYTRRNTRTQNEIGNFIKHANTSQNLDDDDVDEEDVHDTNSFSIFAPLRIYSM